MKHLEIRARLLSVIMEFIHKEGFSDYDSYSRKLANTYINLIDRFGLEMEFDVFLKECKKIKTSFFRLNRVKKHDFLLHLFSEIMNEDLQGLGLFAGFEVSSEFISKYLEIGFRTDKYLEERKILIDKIMMIKKPHEHVMTSFNELLQKITNSYHIDLHGTKEYSGIDICKRYKGENIGFQIKTKDDDISEHMIRSEASKAQEWGLKGFVMVYALKRNRKVDASIQAAFHHFKRIIDNRTMYCSIIHPELLAELFRLYSISV